MELRGLKWTIALAYALFAFAAVVEAQDSGAASDVEAIVREAKAARAEGKLEEAARDFARAYRLSSDAEYLREAHEAYRSLKDFEMARDALAAYLAAAGGRARDRRQLQRRLDAMERSLGAPRPFPPPEPEVEEEPEPEVALEDVAPVESTPEAAEVEEPAPVEEASADVPGQQAVEPMERQDPPPARRGLWVPGLLVAGGGVLAALGGGVTAYFVIRWKEELQTACPNKWQCPAELEPVHQRARTFALVTDILWGVGAVAAVTGLVLALTVHPPASSVESDRASADLSCGPTGCLATFTMEL